MSHPQLSSILRIKRGQPVDLPVALLHPKAIDFPVDVVKVSAGFPSPAADYEEQRLDLHAYLIRNPSSTFFFPVEGESMKGAGIFDGDILIVDRSIQPKHDQIVVAFVDGERLVKRLSIQGRQVALVPANPRYPTLVLQEGNELEIWGVVIGQFRKML